MNDDEELIDEADVTPTPEPEDTPEPESMEADPVAQDDVELVDESDVETVNEGDVQALPEAPPPVAERTPMPASEALPLLAAQGATLGFRDELAGGIMGAVEGVKTLPQGPGAAFMAAREKYRQVSEAERAKTKAAREDFPVAGMATEMAGGFAVPFGAAKSLGTGIMGAIGAGGVFGGISGAGEADPGERISGAAAGAGTGALFGGTMAAIPRVLTSGAVATGAKALAPGLDAPFYAEMLRDPVLRKRALDARKNNPDPAAAGEQVGDLFGDVVGGVRAKAAASRDIGNQELIQSGFLGKPMDDAVRHVENQLAFIEKPENAHNYTPKFKETLYRAYQNLKGFFPEANAAQGQIAQLDGLQQKAAKTALDLQKAQQSSNKSALMQARANKLQAELQGLQAQIAPLKDKVDGILIKGYHEARQDLDDVIDWNPMSNIPRPSRADQHKAVEVRQYIDGVMKSQPSWRAHDELYASWAPLEKALKKNILENGGNGNVSYKKVWSLISGAGGEPAMAGKKQIIDDFVEYVSKNFSNDPDIIDRLSKFQRMTEDLMLSKRMQNLSASTGMTTGRFGNIMTKPLAAASAPVALPVVWLNALNAASSAKDFLARIHPHLPNSIRNRVIIMANQALKQKPDMTAEEMASLTQSQISGGE